MCVFYGNVASATLEIVIVAVKSVEELGSWPLHD